MGIRDTVVGAETVQPGTQPHQAPFQSILSPGGLSDDELARAVEWVRGLTVQ